MNSRWKQFSGSRTIHLRSNGHDGLPAHDGRAPRRCGSAARTTRSPRPVGHAPESLVDLVNASVVDAVNVAIGLLFHALVGSGLLPAALRAAVFKHSSQAPATTPEDLELLSE
jgi:hypothetical protein